jgi:hypothetical protein
MAIKYNKKYKNKETSEVMECNLFHADQFILFKSMASYT